MKARVKIIGLAIVWVLLAMRVALGAEKQNWEEEWKKTLQAAGKEGQVNVYIYGSTAPLDTGVFQKKFPEFKLFVVSGLGGQVEERILSERRAEKYLADVVLHGVTPNYTVFYRAKMLDPVRPALILPEVLDESKWFEGKHRYSDREKEYVFVHVGTPQTGSIAYNTGLVDRQEFKSFWDFLNPKWKGKILARDIRGAFGRGTGAMIFYYHNSEIGPKFIRRLFAEMDVSLFRDFRQGEDWLAQGKFPICFFCAVYQAQKQGLPVEEFGVMKEGAGLAPQRGTVALMSKGPHPNAAKIFINWWLSREGQTTMQTALAKSGDTVPDSLREDVPKDMIPPTDRRMKGVKYLDLSGGEVLDMEPIYQVITDALKQAGKK